MTEQELQIALFIDTDQQGAALFDATREICLQRGRLVMVKAYGDFSCSTGTAWVAQSKRHNMVDLRSAHTSAHKNASDMLLCIDAMETLATRPNIDTFALWTGDSDMAPLASRLREHVHTRVCALRARAYASNPPGQDRRRPLRGLDWACA